MAIYHCSIKIISRGKGKSAVAASAYRSGEKITNEYDDVTHDYTRKGGIVHTEILLPANAPPEYSDRTILWNAVEKIEKSSNSQLSREIELALPVELSQEQNISLVQEYVKKHFVDVGMCADICIHDNNDGNPHAHVMLTMRPFNDDKSWGVKQKKEYTLDDNGNKIYDNKKRQYKCRTIPTTDWNEHTKAEEWREGWADAVNTFLENENSDMRIDHRSYERQGIEQIPTIHMGAFATRMERRGIETEQGNRNREINSLNKKLRQINARLNKLEHWLNEATESENTSTNDVITGILNNSEDKTNTQRIKDLQSAAKIHIFTDENEISNMSQLKEVVSDMSNSNKDIREEIKIIDRRLETLDKHLGQAGIRSEHKAIYKKYMEQKPKKRDAFYKSHEIEITAYREATNYLREHLNGHPLNPAVAGWKTEKAELIAKRNELSKKTFGLLDKVKVIESIKRNQSDPIKNAPSKNQDHCK